MPSGVFSLKQQVAAIRQGAWTNQPPTAVNYLVVAGGGGGGSFSGGGGGAGGLLTGILNVVAGTSYTVTIGTGGATSTGGGIGSSGTSSVFGSISTTGGGGGGGGATVSNGLGRDGGSGGGGAYTNPGPKSNGVSGQGNGGGASSTYGGGGGGAGTVGLNSTSSVSGNGGAGIASSISGSVVTYAGGGAAGDATATGGVGGGGNTTVSGTANTGGGGGASGGNGGSGIVIVSYPGTTQWFTGGTVYYANGNVVHVFTSSGTLAPTTATPANSSYTISRSLRFNSADSAYLSRTPGSAGNRKTWTWSGWVKRSGLTASNTLFGSGTSGTDYCFLYFQNDDKLVFYNYSSAGVFPIRSTPLYRDVSAWYHVVVAVDTTQATASNRVKLWVNNQQITDFSEATYPNQNNDLVVNSTSAHAVGAFLTGSPSGYFNGYMAEVNFIDGQALTPSSFGETSNFTGVWVPKAYTGTYGTNGFYVNFSDNSNTTAATLGKDYSGNGNNWTPNNFSVTAGAGNDSLVDSPTAYGFDTGVGGTVRGNYCTWNPVAAYGSSAANGNLDATVTGSGFSGASLAIGSIGVSSGKWYWEVTPISGAGFMIGISDNAGPYNARSYGTAFGWGYFFSNGNKYNNGTNSAYGATYTGNDVIGVALDMDSGTLTFYKNGVSQGVAYSGLNTGRSVTPMVSDGSGVNNQVYYANFGQRPFAYTAPSGYKALCTQNLLTPAVVQGDDYFNTVLYTGTLGSSAGTQAVTGVGFQPDFTWIKNRNVAGENNVLVDAVRGYGTSAMRTLYSNQTVAEQSNASSPTEGPYYGNVQSLNSDGFTVASSGYATPNMTATSGWTYVAWNWKANGAGSTNTAGSITSTVSANTTSGFSIVTYTTTGSVVTVGHGLGVAPSMIIVKARGTTSDWYTYHVSLGATKGFYLNQTAAEITSANFWNNTAPTSTVFTSGTGVVASGNTAVAYCFAAIPGFSAFGSYTGNGSTDGPFVFTGMRPAFIMIKRTDNVGSWIMLDTVRNTFNVMDKTLWANLSDAEGTYTILDAVSNGFKLREASNGYNNNGATYIYATFASNPFKYSLAR